jgi:hypothetical protein
MIRGLRFRSVDWLDPPVAQCLETHAERIDEHEPADKSALALLGRLSWELVDSFLKQASEKPAHEQTSSGADRCGGDASAGAGSAP